MVRKYRDSALTSIPTDDAQEALGFCRALATVLAQEPRRSDDSERAATPFEYHRIAVNISIVTACHNEEENLETFYERLTAILDSLKADYEIIFVDDGSFDNSPAILQNLSENDPRVIVLQLARNYGQQVAFSAGLDYSCGKTVVLMDSDLQDPPEAIPAFLEKWRDGYDVVYAIRTNRKENAFKRGAYALFYRMMNAISQVEIPLDAGDFCLMDRCVVDVMTSLPERNRFLRGLRSWAGRKQIGIPVERGLRHAGEPKYTLRKLFLLAISGFVSFSFVPLRAISILGMLISLLSLVLALFYGIKKMLYGLHPPGFATLVVMISFFTGIQLITMGVIGEYLGRVFVEVKRRPLYVVKNILRKDS